MFIQVRLLSGFSKPLWYAIPDSWQSKPSAGTIIQVPLRNRIVPALVVSEHQNKPTHISFAIKEATAIEAFPDDRGGALRDAAERIRRKGTAARGDCAGEVHAETWPV